MSSNSNSNDIFEAAASGDLEFIRKNINLINQKNERGWTPLHFAARFGQLEAAQLLKQSKADLTIKSDDGKTAGQLASLWGQEAIAELLGTPATSLTAVADEAPKTYPFPDNYVAVFSGNPLNRFGWKRTDNGFLSRLARSNKAKYMIFNGQNTTYDERGDIRYFGYEDVASVVEYLYKKEDDTAHENVSDVILVFLGLDESEGTGEEGGIPYWALDLTPKKGELESMYKTLVEGFEAQGFTFKPTLPHAYGMEKPKTAIIAQAASIIDWNARNKYCAACGERTVLLEGGYKRSCPAGNGCISHSSVQNFNYPRTDPVVIMCIIHPDGDKILLGRQKRWPKRMYSCIAGFVEAGETLEEAVRREALEETGIVVDRVAYHSSQPWPFPNSLMLGFMAEATSTDIHYSDDELEKAGWYTRTEVAAALKEDIMEAVPRDPNAPFAMAPEGSLAHTLVASWINDKKWQTKPTPVNAKI